MLTILTPGGNAFTAVRADGQTDEQLRDTVRDGTIGAWIETLEGYSIRTTSVIATFIVPDPV